MRGSKHHKGNEESFEIPLPKRPRNITDIHVYTHVMCYNGMVIISTGVHQLSVVTLFEGSFV